MNDKTSLISESFKSFMSEAPSFAGVWSEAIQKLTSASALDEKTRAIAYLSILAALGRVSGIPFHVASLKEMGVSRDEVISAILLGLPAAGHVVTQSLPTALEVYDGDVG
jgi:alkylhydroperoxidase/carboxymuconolactone decarboxylase family protein YurZ